MKTQNQEIEMINRQFRRLIAGLSSNVAAVVGVVMLTGAVGTYFLVQSHAVTPTASIQPENGTLTGGALAALSDATASGGKAVKFNAAAPPPTGCTVSAILVNSCRPWLGAAVEKYPQVAAGVRSQLEYHEQRIGRQVDIVHDYHGVGSNTLNADEKYFASRPNTYVFSNWKPAASWASAGGGNASINAGIDQMAASVKSVAPHKIFMTINHEPENDVTPGTSACATSKGGSGSPADFRNMWANVEARFNADGATNVVWVLDFINYAPFDCMINDLYPGNNLVDWVMFNAYGGPNTPNFVTNTSHLYNFLTTNSTTAHDYLSKPWGIVEWNSRNSSTAVGSSYYDQAKAALDSNKFPKLKAYMIFDDVGPDGNENRILYDDTGAISATKQQHYINFANDPKLVGNGQ